MTPKTLVVIFLLTTEFGYIQNEQHSGSPLWRNNAEVVEKMKKMDAKFSKEFLPVKKGAMPIDEEEDVSSGEMIEVASHEEPKKLSNKLKRETRFPVKFQDSMKSAELKDQFTNYIKKFNEDVSMHTSAELENSEEYSEEMSDLEIMTVEEAKALEKQPAEETTEIDMQF